MKKNEALELEVTKKDIHILNVDEIHSQTHGKEAEDKYSLDNIFSTKSNNKIPLWKNGEGLDNSNSNDSKKTSEVKKEGANEVSETVNEVKEEEEVNNEFEEIKSELQKSENARKNARDSLSKLSIKLKNYEKRIAKFLNDGLLSEDDAELLLSETNHDHEELQEKKNLSPLEKILDSASLGIEQYRKSIEDGLLDEDDLIDSKVESFDFFMNECSKEEREDTINDLKRFIDKPVILAKKMLEIGAKYYEDGYKDFHEAGGFLKYKQKQLSERDKLKKEVDKLNKEVLRYKEQYENFIEPKTMKLPSGGSQSHKLGAKDTSLEAIFGR